MTVSGRFGYHTGLHDVTAGVRVDVGGTDRVDTRSGNISCLSDGCRGVEVGSVAGGLEGTSGNEVKHKGSKKQLLC
jgi:hypothetical protein